jgi:hypothetical protein
MIVFYKRNVDRAAMASFPRILTRMSITTRLTVQLITARPLFSPLSCLCPLSSLSLLCTTTRRGIHLFLATFACICRGLSLAFTGLRR